MRYTVIWTPDTETQLADIWTTATDREAVTQSAAALDILLSETPEDRGESREFGHRILIGQPLVVIFEVFAADRMVRVLRVWKYTKHR